MIHGNNTWCWQKSDVMHHPRCSLDVLGRYIEAAPGGYIEAAPHIHPGAPGSQRLRRLAGNWLTFSTPGTIRGSLRLRLNFLTVGHGRSRRAKQLLRSCHVARHHGVCSQQGRSANLGKNEELQATSLDGGALGHAAGLFSFFSSEGGSLCMYAAQRDARLHVGRSTSRMERAIGSRIST